MKIIEKTFDIATGLETIIERNETAEETTERLNLEKATAEAQAKTEAKEAARSALLDKLGISADEAKLLLGQ